MSQNLLIALFKTNTLQLFNKYLKLVKPWFWLEKKKQNKNSRILNKYVKRMLRNLNR